MFRRIKRGIQWGTVLGVSSGLGLFGVYKAKEDSAYDAASCSWKKEYASDFSCSMYPTTCGYSCDLYSDENKFEQAIENFKSEFLSHYNSVIIEYAPFAALAGFAVGFGAGFYYEHLMSSRSEVYTPLEEIELPTVQETTPALTRSRYERFLKKIDYRDDIPEEMECSLTNEIMTNPVYFIDTPETKFERNNITHYLTHVKKEHPISLRPVEEDELINDEILSKKIDTFVKTKAALILQKAYRNRFFCRRQLPNIVIEINDTTCALSQS